MDKQEDPNDIVSMKEEREELSKLLGAPFEEFIASVEEAERKLAEHASTIIDPDDMEPSLKFLRFLSCFMGTKAGMYASGASISFGLDPVLAFDTVQKRLLTGLWAGVAKHKTECGNPQCEAAHALTSFLAQVAGLTSAVERMQARAVAAAVPRGPDGKPVIN